MSAVALRKSDSESKELHEKEEIPHHRSTQQMAAQIVRQLLDSGFEAKIVSGKTKADGTETWRVILSKRGH